MNMWYKCSIILLLQSHLKTPTPSLIPSDIFSASAISLYFQGNRNFCSIVSSFKGPSLHGFEILETEQPHIVEYLVTYSSKCSLLMIRGYILRCNISKARQLLTSSVQKSLAIKSKGAYLHL